LKAVGDEMLETRKRTDSETINECLMEISEAIAFLDYSFERAFSVNEKNYILAYKKHALVIQEELDNLRTLTFDVLLQAENKAKKIGAF
jgi:hypothetical protein